MGRGVFFSFEGPPRRYAHYTNFLKGVRVEGLRETNDASVVATRSIFEIVQFVQDYCGMCLECCSLVCEL